MSFTCNTLFPSSPMQPADRVAYKKPVWSLYESAEESSDDEDCEMDDVPKFSSLPTKGNVEITLYCDMKILKERHPPKKENLPPYEEEEPNAISRGILELYKSKQFADFHLVRDGKRYPCHKLVLASRSAVLRDLMMVDEGDEGKKKDGTRVSGGAVLKRSRHS